MTSRLTREMVGEARELLRLMGIPVVQAPSEAEAQAAQMAAAARVWAAASKDYDALLFGAPRVVRFLSISGREFLPSRRESRPIVPELLDLDALLAAWTITREQLIDLAILVGTDFNDGVKGIGPKKALALVREHGRIEAMPEDIQSALGDISEVRRIYLSPDVTDEYDMHRGTPDIAGIRKFLCVEREFSEERVSAALDRAFGRNGATEPTLF
jgi:flap endonuclease-1